MPTGIPLPIEMGEALRRGMNTGTNIFNSIMTPILHREQQKQLENHFNQELALKKQQEQRLGANSGLNRQLLQQQILNWQHKNDPNYEFNQFKALQDMIMGGGQPGGQQGGAAMPTPQETQPTQETGEGMGMFSPEGMQQAQKSQQQSPQESPQGTPGMNFDALRQNPMLRGFFKHKFGFDPLAAVPQTPEEKQAAALDLFRKKEEIKNEKEAAMPAAIKTLHENIIHLSPKADAAIEHIINMPSPLEPYGLGFIKSGQKAAHNKAVTAAAENYSKAKGWPNTKGSIEKAESILQRGNFETDYDYHKRLREYQEELRNGIISSNQFLHPGKQQSESNIKSNDPLGIR